MVVLHYRLEAEHKDLHNYIHCHGVGTGNIRCQLSSTIHDCHELESLMIRQKYEMNASSAQKVWRND